MTAATTRGTHFDGRRPLGREVELTIAGDEAWVRGADLDARHPVAALRVSPRVGGADRFVALPDDTQVLCPDAALLESLPQEIASEGPVAWLERRWGVALAALAVVAAVVAAGYLWGLPAAAERLAAQVPIASEEFLGKQALGWLDSQHWLGATRLAPARRDALRTSFATLHQGLASSPHLRLEFRRAPMLGPNAVALPGGVIVLTDEMAELAAGDAELLAVLAHEIGHVERRHALRSLLQSSGIALIGVLLTGDAASIATGVVGLPISLAQAAYSRDMESEADEFAFALLLRRGRSPMTFATLMARLQRRFGDGAIWSYLSSHPVTEERIARARAAATR